VTHAITRPPHLLAMALARPFSICRRDLFTSKGGASKSLAANQSGAVTSEKRKVKTGREEGSGGGVNDDALELRQEGIVLIALANKVWQTRGQGDFVEKQT